MIELREPGAVAHQAASGGKTGAFEDRRNTAAAGERAKFGAGAEEQIVIRDDQPAGRRLGQLRESTGEILAGGGADELDLQPNRLSGANVILDLKLGLRGLTNSPSVDARGIEACSSSRRLRCRSPAVLVTPVTFTVRLPRLARRPISTGSGPIAKTTGIFLIAALAANAAGKLDARSGSRV